MNRFNVSNSAVQSFVICVICFSPLLHNKIFDLKYSKSGDVAASSPVLPFHCCDIFLKTSGIFSDT